MLKRIIQGLAVLSVTSAFASAPTMPAHMPSEPMPKFNFTMLKLHHPLRHHHVVHAHHQVVRHHLPHHDHHARVCRRLIRHAELKPGSLKGNIMRLSQANGWPHVIWQTGNDFYWVGHVHVASQSYPGILRQILQRYPLQANFYEGNHVLVITPRTLQS